MPKFGGMFFVPEQCVIRVSAYRIRYRVQTGLGDVGESEVGGIRHNRLKQRENRQAVDVYALQQFFQLKEFVERLVGSNRCCGSEAYICLASRQQSYVEKVWDNKILCSRLAQHKLASGQPCGNLQAQNRGRPSGC